MKKKLSLIICLTLIVGSIIPIVSIALAKKPDQVPPPLEKIVFIHYKRHAKPPWAGGPGGPNGDEEEEKGYYELLGKGVKWKALPIDISIGKGITKSAIVAAMIEWDEHTSTLLYSAISYKRDASWDDDAPDGTNELVFGDYPTKGVIAVTVIWGYFNAPPPFREIIEFDIMFDTDYTWGDAGSTNDDTGFGEDLSVMDLQNIATHELGHGLGLDDLYYSAASDETMFGYSSYGETKKRTLYYGDIAGIQDLYGP